MCEWTEQSCYCSMLVIEREWNIQTRVEYSEGIPLVGSKRECIENKFIVCGGKFGYQHGWKTLVDSSNEKEKKKTETFARADIFPDH